jgi:hypothetical protein
VKKANLAGRDPLQLRGELAVAALLAMGAFFEGAGRHRRAYAAAIPIIGVNSIAFLGQLGFLHSQLHWIAAGQILFAAVLESIAVYLSYQAHLALVADDAALRIRLAAYGMALIISVMNYSHYRGPHWHPTFMAVAFALCSAVSPGLWSVYSRRQSRDRLLATGDIEPHAVRLGVTRWVWHFYRSVRVMWLATWEGESTPVRAIALLDGPSRRQRRAALRGLAAGAGRIAEISGAPVSAGADGSTGIKLPPPARPRKEPRPGRPPGRRVGQAAAGRASRQDGPVDETALLAEILASGKPLPSVRSLSLEKAGIPRSRQVERVLETARARMNGHGGH